VSSAQRTLTAMLRAMFPHPRFPDGPYERSAAAILDDAEADVRLRGQLEQGFVALDAKAGRPFVELEQQQALDVLRAISDSVFFESIRAKTILTLYNDSEVWQLLGYEGASYAQGGYLDRGFGDLDWLPEPSIGEVKS
jgi:hypothetical protein